MTFEGFVRALSELNIPWSSKQIPKIFQLCDYDKYTSLSYHQFVYALHICKKNNLLFIKPLYDNDPEDYKEIPLPYKKQNTIMRRVDI